MLRPQPLQYRRANQPLLRLAHVRLSLCFDQWLVNQEQRLITCDLVGSRFNQPIGPHRKIAWRQLDLGRVKAAAKKLGGTINDAVLTMVSGAIGATLRHQGESVPRDGLELSLQRRRNAPAVDLGFAHLVHALQCSA